MTTSGMRTAPCSSRPKLRCSSTTPWRALRQQVARHQSRRHPLPPPATCLLLLQACHLYVPCLGRPSVKRSLCQLTCWLRMCQAVAPAWPQVVRATRCARCSARRRGRQLQPLRRRPGGNQRRLSHQRHCLRSRPAAGPMRHASDVVRPQCMAELHLHLHFASEF